jgi:hypothetical protein
MKIHLTNSQKRVYLGSFLSECSGGYREGETPGPIPNPEAKTLFAHNTASFRCGNVGRRLASDFFILFFFTITTPFFAIIITTASLSQLLFTDFNVKKMN